MQPKGDRQVVLSFRLEHFLGWTITIVLCLIPVFLWSRIHPFSQINGFVPIMLNLGRITGLIGMVMFSLNLIYATRLRFLERFFGGLNRVYIAHHLLGGLALIFLAFHPLFLSLRYVTTSLKQAALLLVPNGLAPVSALLDKSSFYHPIVLQQWALFLGIVAFWGMVALLLVTFFIKIPYRIWLITHKFLGLFFFLGALHVLFITTDTSVDKAMKYYIFGITILGLIAYIYRTLAGSVLIRHYQYTVDDVKKEGGNVTKLKMRPVKDKMSYKPGQFVFIRFKNTGTKLSKEWHPFSISSGTSDDHLEVSVKGLGDYTNYLGNIKPGAIATIEGAYGRFSNVNFKNKNQIWIAGGIGVTPFISMAKSLPNKDYEIDFYYSVKTYSELIDWDVLRDLPVAKNGYIRIFPYVSDQKAGHLGADYIIENSGDITNKDIYICGPPAMMKAMRKQLKAKKVPGTSIHSEEFAMS